MKLVVVGPPFPFEKETNIINELFELGMEYHHIRSPFIEEDVQRKFIKRIKKKHRSKLVIHQHHDMAEDFEIKGVHLKETHRKLMHEGEEKYVKWLDHKKANPDFHLSASFHDLADLVESQCPYNYAFIGPVFSSISKTNYSASWSMAALERAIGNSTVPIVTIGGIRPEHIDQVKEWGASGVATLGYIWNSKDPVKAFLDLKEKCDQISTS